MGDFSWGLAHVPLGDVKYLHFKEGKFPSRMLSDEVYRGFTNMAFV